MLAELRLVLQADPYSGRDDVGSLVLSQNILQKTDWLRSPPQLAPFARIVWVRGDTTANLAGDDGPMGARRRWTADAGDPCGIGARGAVAGQRGDHLGGAYRRCRTCARAWQLTSNSRYPGRYTPKMLRSLSQNCASSWTQSGHLEGKVRKERTRPEVSPRPRRTRLCSVPWPALAARRCSPPLARGLGSFGGGTPDLLRGAEAHGLLRLRAGGDVIEIEVSRHMAAALGIPELADD